jgi:two-component system chemotaxis response regulator CheY
VHGGSISQRGRGLKLARLILVVDDSASMRLLVTETLTRAGYDTVEATNGVEGLARARRRDVAGIVCDIHMPRMNGIEMVEQLRAENLDVPVMMLTTEGQIALIQRAKMAGAKSWMVKPFKPELLVKAVNKIAGAPYG